MVNAGTPASVMLSEGGTDRPVVVLVIGLLSLFRTTGIYYLRELLRSYDVVLVGWRDDGNDRTFHVAAGWPGVRRVELLPPPWEPRSYHRAAAALAHRLGTQVRPVVLLQHADCYPHNLYLIRALSRDKGLVRATFANGFTFDHLHDFAHRRADEVARIMARRGIPQFAAWPVFWTRSFLYRIMRFYLLPATVGEWPLRGHTDLDTGRIHHRRITPFNDVHLMYTERERDHYRRMLEPASVELIRHPVQIVGDEVHRELRMPVRGQRIALLPTNAFINTLSLRLGAERAIGLTGAFWSRAVVILRERLGGVPVIAKLHPAAATDDRMKSMLEHVRVAIPDIEVAAPEESAERIILGSGCVVSDVSSVLWWTRMLSGRIAVSLDPWQLDGSDEFRHHPGVIYVNDPEALRGVELVSAAAEPDRCRPTLTEMLDRKLIEKRRLAGEEDGNDKVWSIR